MTRLMLVLAAAFTAVYMITGLAACVGLALSAYLIERTKP
jgi:putative Ca2+/H+ antiporter (TMEM165/GDT1 family)